MPPARLRVSGSEPTVPQREVLVTRSGTVLIRNIVVPYISIRSPTPCAPTLIASAHASIVPVITGMSTGSPVSAAASRVVTPATSPGQRNGGSDRPDATRSTQGWYHSRFSVSYSGAHWLAAGGWGPYSPWALWTNHELGMTTRGARAKGWSSLSATPTTFAPAACVERAEPHRRRISSGPSW